MPIPMRLTCSRLVESGCRARNDIMARLEFWAGRYGFQRVPTDDMDLRYERGSHWDAAYTFDIRKVPTKVTIRVVDENLGTCACVIFCGSWLQYSTTGDEKRLSEQMDMLEGILKGAVTEKSDASTVDMDFNPS